MTKTAAATQLPVGQFVTGMPIVADDAAQIVEQLNWSHRERVCEVLLADDQVDVIPTTGGFVERRRTRLWIDVDALELEALVVATVDTGEVVTARTTIGADAVDQAITDADSGVAQIATLLTSNTGTGWQTVTLELEHTTGSGSACTRDLWQIQAATVDAPDAPDPEP